MTNAQHTPLQHSENNVVSNECPNNPTNASTTETQSPTYAELEAVNTKDKSAINALNAGQPMSSETGEKSSSSLSRPTAASVHVAASNILSFLQSITLEEMAESIETPDFAATSFINGLLRKDTRKEIIGCFVSTATALAANTGNAHTKINTRLIAAAPEMFAECLRAQDEIASAIRDGVNHFDDKLLRNWFRGISAVIAKAKGE